MKSKRTTPDLAVVRRVWGADGEKAARKLIKSCDIDFGLARGYSTPQGVEVALTPTDDTLGPWYLRRVKVEGDRGLEYQIELDEAGVDDIALMFEAWPPAWRVPVVAEHLTNGTVLTYLSKGKVTRRRRGALEFYARAEEVPQTPHRRARALTAFKAVFHDIEEVRATLRGDDDPDETPAPKVYEARGITIDFDGEPAAEVIGTDLEVVQVEEEPAAPTAQDRIDCIASTIGDLIEALFAEGFAPRHAVALVRAAATQACDCYDTTPARWRVSYAGDDLVVMAPSDAQAIEVFAASFGYPSAEAMTALLDGEVSVEPLQPARTIHKQGQQQ